MFWSNMFPLSEIFSASVCILHEIINFLQGRKPSTTALHNMVAAEMFDKFSLIYIFTALKFYTEHMMISNFPIDFHPKGIYFYPE